MIEKFVFKPRARLLLQLGDQLIKNESIALLELVKNSYDADATQVYVILSKMDKPDLGTIIIEDNGTGMDGNIIKDVWMEPGSDYKERLYEEKKKSQEFKRLPLGEKGIGRFSAHKLGNEIELISRKQNGREVYLRIEWNFFKESKYLGDVPINIYERKPEIFTGNKTGTRIIIRKLKTGWNRGMVREVYRSINSLCSPFDSPDSFKVIFDLDRKEWLEGLLSWKKVRDSALFKVECEIEGQEIKEFKYEFTPWPSMKKLHSRKVTKQSDEVKKLKKMVYKDNKPIDLSPYKIGKIRFEAFIFDRDPKILTLGVQDKKGLKEYLNANGGIRIYRDGIRVYDYGEPGNDWLELGIRRVNMPTKKISNNLIIGAVHLRRADSTDLTEKTNREGFIDNEACNTFRDAVLYVLNLIETFRNIDKDRIRKFYGPTPVSEPVISSINDLKIVVEKEIKDEKLKKEVGTYLKRIEEDYRSVNEILLRSAGAGLNLSVVVHEIEKIIDELKKIIQKEKPSDRIIYLVKHLSQLVEGYSVLIRGRDKKTEKLKNIINQAVFNIEFRLEAHKINLIKAYSKFRNDTAIKCARNLVLGTITNIMDNSIWWLEYGGIKNKKIFISVSDELEGFTSIIIADNGPGFALPTTEITKPFVSAKPDGMGLGLHIAKEVMEAHKGELIFPAPGDFSIPEEFKTGAVIGLAFRKGVKK